MQATCSQRELRVDSGVPAAEDPQQASGDKAAGQEGRGPRHCACFLFKPARGKQVFPGGFAHRPKVVTRARSLGVLVTSAGLHRGASRSLKPPPHPAQQGWPPSGAAPPQPVPHAPACGPS